jgi:molecular chaperone DnaK
MGKRVYAIDLGTTYSCIGYVNDSGKPEIVPNAEGDLTTPSVIYFESADNIVVGKQAKNSAKLYPDRTFAFVKRDMGHPTVYELDGKQYKPEELSSLILRKLVGDAAQATDEEITDVVITCPAYFGINEREATRNAGVLAGLNVRHILNEPTAAAYCYGMDKADEDSVVCVYDLGGGTFDCTMIEIKGGNIRVVYTTGIHSLGGKDWDDRLVTYLAEQFMAQFPDKGDPRDDPITLQDLVNSAEDIKKGLSAKDKWPAMVTHAGSRARVEVIRAKQDETHVGFEELTVDLLEQTIELTKTVLEEGKARGCGAVSKILLVGGSSKMPYVARRLNEAIGIETQMFEPDLAVAKGAALVALKIMAGQMLKDEIASGLGVDADKVDLEKVDDKTLQQAAEKLVAQPGAAFRLPAKEIVGMATSKIINVTSKGFGVVVADDEEGVTHKVVYMIHNNTPVPVEVTETGFGTLKHNQRSVHIRVMEQSGQSESSEIQNNRDLKDGELAGLPPGLPAGSPIHVTFRLEEDGTLKVTAVETTSRQELHLEAKLDGVMSAQEVEERKELMLKKSVS